MQAVADEGTTRFLAKVADALGEIYAPAMASSLVSDYYSKFTDPSYCKALGIPVQDDDFFFHEGVSGLALRIHYYLGLGGDPTPAKYIEWRSARNGWA